MGVLASDSTVCGTEAAGSREAREEQQKEK
jgi:hypothetical protein